MRFFFLLSVIFYSCSNDPELVKEFIATENLPIEKIEGAEMLHTEKGVLKVKIIATTIKRFKDIRPQLVFSNGLEVIFYNDSGLVKSVLTATNAEVDEINNIMTASENVVLMSSEGKKLETEELIWDENKNKIYTDKKVVVTTGKEVIEGEDFETNPDFSEYSISKIQGTFNFENTTN
jgi:LPS export ABC transporter protein LptC